jgi:hypothetical protein
VRPKCSTLVDEHLRVIAALSLALVAVRSFQQRIRSPGALMQTLRAILSANWLGLAISFPLLLACGTPDEAPRIELPVVVDASGITRVTTDLGYDIELTEARLIIENIVFTIAGEAHARSSWRRVSDFLVPTAHAHEGHFQGGDVTGELRGRFVLDFLPGADRELGTATLLVGSYKSAEFTFAIAGSDDEVDAGDPLFGRTALLRGLATKDEQSIEFVAAIESPEGRELIGARFEFEAKVSSLEELCFRLNTTDPFEGDTLFDGIDFAMLDDDGDGRLSIEPASNVSTYNLLRRTFQTHDHFDVIASEPQN